MSEKNANNVFLALTLKLIEVILFFYSRPIVSEKNELFIQFLSDLSLTADGFIGHYKFRPKKLPTTTVPPTTTTVPATSSKFFWLYLIIELIYSRKRGLEKSNMKHNKISFVVC